MVEIKKVKKGKQEYYYLFHNYREGKKWKGMSTYLGKEKPKDVERLKRAFMEEFYQHRFLSKINEIKKGYSKDQKAMSKSAKEKELDTFAVKFTYNTQRIEGSTLTLRETSNLLDKGITPKEKSIDDVKEAEAHEKVFYEMLNYKKDLSLQAVLLWHKHLLEQTKKDVAGKIRDHGVAITGSKFVPPLPVEMNILLKEFFDWYKKAGKKLHAVELASLVHLKFVTIHPFSDGNGRISRLMMNFVLNKHDFPLFDVPFKARTSYYNSLERSQLKKEDMIFLQWFFKKYTKENKSYLRNG